MKESVSVYLGGVTDQLPYRNYYEQRNGHVSRDIASLLRLPYGGETHSGGEQTFIVPAKTLSKEQARKMGVNEYSDFYGVAIASIDQTGKSILHPTLSTHPPAFYSPYFAEKVEDVVLPGITIFRGADIDKSYRLLSESSFGLRLKEPMESDGFGQTAITNKAHLDELLACTSEEKLRTSGILLEAEALNPTTISIGFARIGSKDFSFIAHQKNDIYRGRNRYLGANVLVVPGMLESLYKLPTLSQEEAQAIQAGIIFHESYSHFDPLASRLSFDFLIGTDKNGNTLSGITDITGRLGGTCPALMLAAHEIEKNQLPFVFSEVTLNYESQKSGDDGFVVYVDDPTLRLSARVIHSKTLI